MEQKCMKHLKDTLLNRSKVDVRTVPGVMYQVLCRTDNTDNDTEYRFHWFLNCTETYIHNHRYTFDTYCLEGEYEEKLWEIVRDDNGTNTYQFPRTTGNKFGPSMHVPGALRLVSSRRHFPGNILHVETNQYHSISPIAGSNNHVVTFVARQIRSTAAKNTYILSNSKSIKAPVDEIRPATPEERGDVCNKLRQIFYQMRRPDEFESCYDEMKEMCNIF